eukprot:scaffold610284_cov18-Prasinocladus_malaysianus.AAC.1
MANGKAERPGGALGSEFHDESMKIMEPFDRCEDRPAALPGLEADTEYQEEAFQGCPQDSDTGS